MNDRALSLLEQYDIEVLRTRKGRGTFICDTRQGSLTFKEYSGNPEKLKLQQQILQRVKELGLVKAEELIPNKENQLYVKDNEGKCYIVKTCIEGSECDIYDGRECVEAIQLLARLHHSMEGCLLPEEDEELETEAAAESTVAKDAGAEVAGTMAKDAAAESTVAKDAGAEVAGTMAKNAATPSTLVLPPYSPLKEYEKHNRELMRVWSYLKKKGQKQIFEIRLLGVMEYFVGQAKQVTGSWQALENEMCQADVQQAHQNPQPTRYGYSYICHGDYQYHNILRAQDGWHIVNFEKLQNDNPVRDVYLFVRKVMEKNNWLPVLGKEILSAYEAIRSLDDYSRLDLYHRFAYPEKFWKITNFYFNSSKAWIPEKNLEKLEKVISQEKQKQEFLKLVFPKEVKYLDK